VIQSDPFHLDPDDVAGMADGTLADEERARVVAHIADCAQCRQEIADVRAAQRTAPSRAGLWWLGSAAAAVLAGVFLLGPLLSRGGTDPVLRAASDGPPAIEVVAPSGSPGADERLAFAWRAVAPGAIYTIILMDESADVIWRLDGVPDTTVTVPADRALRPATTYLYVIDAMLPDGRTVTSGTRRLTTRR